MNITKCDWCKKEISGEPIIAGKGYFSVRKVELCDQCGIPILEFLKKHKNHKNKKEINKPETC